MKPLLSLLLAAVVFARPASAQAVADKSTPEHIDLAIPPYYLGEQLPLDVGKYSDDLASTDDKVFVAVIHKMKHDWNTLPYHYLYVASIRLYNMGYRKEAAYWCYTAQYRGWLFQGVVDKQRLGTLGSQAYELNNAVDAFEGALAKWIKGYGYSDADRMSEILARVIDENAALPDLKTIYPGVVFADDTLWKPVNDRVGKTFKDLLLMLRDKEALLENRKKNGIDEKFSKVTSKELPAE